MPLTDEEIRELQRQAAQGVKSTRPTTSQAPVWTPSTNLNNAYNAWQDLLNNRPQGYQSPYATGIDALNTQIQNRPDFAYDQNNDPLYLQYQQMYMNQGNRAMRDTAGQVSALSGGYGNSYAATAGNQAYQKYMQELNGMVPQLYGQALNEYQMEGQDLNNQLSALMAQDNAGLAQHQNAMSEYMAALAAAQSAYDSQYGQEYGQHQEALAQWNADQARQPQGGGSGGGRRPSAQQSGTSGYAAAQSAASDMLRSYSGDAGHYYAANYLRNQVLQGKITENEAYAIQAALGIRPGARPQWNNQPERDEETSYTPPANTTPPRQQDDDEEVSWDELQRRNGGRW